MFMKNIKKNWNHYKKITWLVDFYGFSKYVSSGMSKKSKVHYQGNSIKVIKCSNRKKETFIRFDFVRRSFSPFILFACCLCIVMFAI